MSKSNGKIIYKNNKAFLNGKLVAIGVKEGEHIPRASDYELPKKLSKLDKERIETSLAVSNSLREAFKNEQKPKR